jgi:hypothetical protein
MAVAAPDDKAKQPTKPRGGAGRVVPRKEYRELSAAEAFFFRKLHEANRQLGRIRAILEALAAKLDAARLRHAVEIEEEGDAIEALIREYNEAVELARAAWLRGELGGDAYGRLASLQTPSDLQVPAFTDLRQAYAAKQQEEQIGQRLGRSTQALARILAAIQVLEGSAPGVLLPIGGGVVVTGVQTTGLWSVVMYVPSEKGFPYSAAVSTAGPDTLGGLRLASTIMTWWLLLGGPRPTAATSGLLASEDKAVAERAGEFDGPSDAQYNRDGEQAPATNADLSEDSIGFAGDPSNLYRSVGNGPTNATDPSGLETRVNHTNNLDKDWLHFTLQGLWPASANRSSILQRFGVNAITLNDPPDCANKFKAAQRKGVHVSDMEVNDIVGSDGAAPCIIVVIKGPADRWARAWHFDSYDDIPATLRRDLGPVPGGRAAVAGEDDGRVSNFNLAETFEILQTLGITIDGYSSTDELWVDANGRWVKGRVPQ